MVIGVPSGCFEPLLLGSTQGRAMGRQSYRGRNVFDLETAIPVLQRSFTPPSVLQDRGGCCSSNSTLLTISLRRSRLLMRAGCIGERRMTGETDLKKLLAAMTPELLPGIYVFATLAPGVLQPEGIEPVMI